ncbi:N-acetyltransferase family protein [Legionella sp. D16C41]|uniref:GNAT family N-acetyltransferase n=1 Tax=Legionella sp. D16C41 TaxID=3402688 RepID=UPI003AF6AAF6
MVEVIIRTAQKNDLSAILELYAQPEIDDGKILPLTKAEHLFERINAYPDYKIYAAVDKNEFIVGSFALLIMDNLGHLGAPSGIIEDVVVKPSLQGKSIGKQMLQHAIEICKEKQCYKLALSANLKRQSAHYFYQSLGFKQHGISFLIEFD